MLSCSALAALDLLPYPRWPNFPQGLPLTLTLTLILTLTLTLSLSLPLTLTL